MHSHVVLMLNWRRSNRSVIMLKRSRSNRSVIVLERENTKKGTLPLKRVKQRRKSQTDWGRSYVYRENNDFCLLQTHPVNALPSSIQFNSPLSQAPNTTWLQRTSTCVSPDILREAYSWIRVPSSIHKTGSNKLHMYHCINQTIDISGQRQDTSFQSHHCLLHLKSHRNCVLMCSELLMMLVSRAT